MEHDINYWTPFEKNYSDIKSMDAKGIVLMIIQHFTGSSLNTEKEILRLNLHILFSDQNT